MSRLAALAATEARLLARDWTVLVFAFAFPAFVMLILAGVFGNEPDGGYAGLAAWAALAGVAVGWLLRRRGA